MNTAYAMGAPGGGGGAAGGDFSFIIMMAVLFGIFYFLLIRPQQKKQKAIRNFQNSLKEGSNIVTGGGVYGTVKRIDLEKNVVEIEVAHGVVIRVDKSYVFNDASSMQAVQNK